MSGGIVFIAGWFHLKGLESESERKIAREWLKTPINFTVAKSHITKSTAVFSGDDPYVPLSDSEIYKNEPGSSVIIQPKRGHFTE